MVYTVDYGNYRLNKNINKYSYLSLNKFTDFIHNKNKFLNNWH